MIRNALFLCVVCALIFLFYLPSYVKMQDLNEKNRVYEKRVTDLEQDNTRLEQERRRLVTDPVYFEKVAREKMGIIREDEVVCKIVPQGQRKEGQPGDDASMIIRKEDADTTKDKDGKPSAPGVTAAVDKTVKIDPRPDKGIVSKKVFEKGFSNGSTIFSWLLKNGYFEERSGTDVHPRTLTAAARAGLKKQYPGSYRRIADILQQATHKKALKKDATQTSRGGAAR